MKVTKLLLAWGCVLSAAASLSAADAEVRASSFGWNAEDATACLQAALDSGAKKVIVDRQKGDWIVRPIHIKAREMEIVFQDGVTVRAKKDAFKGRTDCLFRIEGASADIVMRGEGNATLAMNKADYQDPECYASSEWRHTLGIYGRGITVRDLTLLSSGGDGVYVNGARDVVLENLVCRDHHRQGISVIAARNMLVRNCDFSGTWGTPPACGVDLEPNHNRNFFENVVFEDCTFVENAASGILLHLGALDQTSAPVSMTFRRCTVRGNKGHGVTVYVASRGNSARGSVLFDGCRIFGNAGNSLRFVNVIPGDDRLKVTFRDCEVDGRNSADAGIAFNGNIPFSLGNVSFERTTLRISEKGRDFDFAALPGAGLKNVTGLLSVDRSGNVAQVDMATWVSRFKENPSALSFETTPIEYRALRPATNAKRLAKPVRTGNLRGRFTFVQYHGEAGEYPIRFRCQPLGKRSNSVTVQLRDAAGTDLGKFTFTDLDYTYVAKVNGPNVTRFEIDTNSRIDIESEWPGQGIEAVGGVPLFAPGNRRYYFFVPAYGSEVCVMLKPEEPMSATLLDANGIAVEERGFSTKPDILRCKKAAGQAEVWSLMVPRVAEDALFRIGAPALPIVTQDPEAMLVLQ